VICTRTNIAYERILREPECGVKAARAPGMMRKPAD
jgi:hypothetical protein